MLKKRLFNLYKKINLFGGDVTAELGMIYDYLGISTIKELKEGLTQKEEQNILAIVEKRVRNGMPLQQILGFGYFMNEKFKVNSATLIPRPETEILVKECSKLIKKKAKVLDIGTGSGCIAIEIAKLTGAMVDGVDISENALKIAIENSNFHKINNLCKFFISDLFSNVNQKYDFIVSNPPYIPMSQKRELDSVVADFEPKTALFTHDLLGIEYYIKIIKEIDTFLNKNGYLAFELGINQGKHVSEMLENKGFKDIKTFKDLDGIERVIIGKYF